MWPVGHRPPIHAGGRRSRSDSTGHAKSGRWAAPSWGPTGPNTRPGGTAGSGTRPNATPPDPTASRSCPTTAGHMTHRVTNIKRNFAG